MARTAAKVAAGVLALVAVLLAAQATLVLTAEPVHPLRIDPLLPDAARAPVDADIEVARMLAPWILHETHHALGRMDIPAAMDFDGDMDGANAWESLPRHELLPTVYYTVAESETHWFVSYHLYHPRDWAAVSLGVQDTHEGDGENVHVVAEKTNMSPVLVTTQAHERAWSYAAHPGPITSGEETLRGDFEVQRGHPVVYVESGGHGIYGSRDPRAANRLARIGEPVLTLRPAEEAELVREPAAPYGHAACLDAPDGSFERCGGGEYAYRLVSLPAFLDGSTSHERLFADEGRFRDHPVPRYHLGDRYSGPLGPSRGISPFALGYSFDDGELGALFWDPAATYADVLTIEGPWARALVRHAFG